MIPVLNLSQELSVEYPTNIRIAITMSLETSQFSCNIASSGWPKKVLTSDHMQKVDRTEEIELKLGFFKRIFLERAKYVGMGNFPNVPTSQ